jgi:hypothetical protein
MKILPFTFLTLAAIGTFAGSGLPMMAEEISSGCCHQSHFTSDLESDQ